MRNPEYQRRVQRLTALLQRRQATLEENLLRIFRRNPLSYPIHTLDDDTFRMILNMYDIAYIFGVRPFYKLMMIHMYFQIITFYYYFI